MQEVDSFEKISRHQGFQFLRHDYGADVRELKQRVSRLMHPYVGGGLLSVGNIPPEERAAAAPSPSERASKTSVARPRISRCALPWTMLAATRSARRKRWG
jgi:hypothetical protein